MLPELAPLLWHSFGMWPGAFFVVESSSVCDLPLLLFSIHNILYFVRTVAALRQEIAPMYPAINSPMLMVSEQRWLLPLVEGMILLMDL